MSACFASNSNAVIEAVYKAHERQYATADGIFAVVGMQNVAVIVVIVVVC
jgi:hypothetical protein